MKIYKRFSAENRITLYNGDSLKLLKQIPSNSVDMIITSPPYCIGKEYEDPQNDIESFKNEHKRIFPDIYRVLKPGGSLCWQVGYHINDATVFPLDFFVYDIFVEGSKDTEYPLLLRNRIIWTFGHGLNGTQRFSGRHETILWFTKGKNYNFDLDSIRIPQKYPGKRSYKGPNKGKLSGNLLGKNPSDVWDIPNVKAQHVEKTEHPCQFPVAIPRRLIKALTPVNGLVLDPYAGAGTSGVAAVLENRRFVGAEILSQYYDISIERIKAAERGEAKVREDVPVVEPNLNSSVAKLPEEFAKARGEYY
ncbi:DNA-methyltransferase [Gorillibacterium timonense]|uniref:DNA-methyltransferase n=1 Tax=Gorillibacterium timonense TaxID=1689269 RepID=UPI00071D4D64|nr:site-specific DNA-methyltransferase [Gorillibacterium timonense]